MRKTRAILWTVVAAAQLVPAVAFAMQVGTPRKVADGGFETGSISLSLPAVEDFPMVANGWASRGGHVPAIVDDALLAFAGKRSLRLTSGPDDRIHLIQDLPLTTAGFALQFAFRIERGSQSVQVVSGWDRRVPVGGDVLFGTTLSAAGLEVTTPGGRWQLARPLATNTWHLLSIVADPRTGLQSVHLDGVNVLSLPGSPSAGPVTLVLGDAGGSAESVFGYDAIELTLLADLELAAIRAAVDESIGDPSRAWIVRRLDTAMVALERGAVPLALPELRVAARLAVGAPWNGSGGRAGLDLAAPARDLVGALENLLALLEAGR